MRTVTLTYIEDGFFFEDNDGQVVIVRWNTEDTNRNVTICSKLHGDEEYVYETVAKVYAEIEALFLLGIPSER
jgi:hypothetical protein